jgi:hypothetical protein
MSPPLAPILSQTNPVRTIPPYISKIHFSIAHPPTSFRPSGLFRSGFPIKILYAFLFAPIRATCPAHLVLLDLIILIMFGVEHKF